MNNGAIANNGSLKGTGSITGAGSFSGNKGTQTRPNAPTVESVGSNFVTLGARSDDGAASNRVRLRRG